MTDRSATMRAVKAINTKPELLVRKLLFSLGYRFRIHAADLPGKPDIVFRGRRKAIFVHGCFWHGHNCKRGARVPKTNTDYWRSKIARNVRRDLSQLSALASAGWQIHIVWECELRKQNIGRSLVKFLGSPRAE